MDYTKDEQMIVATARELKNADAAYVGVGIPTRAALLARQTLAPELTIIFETGVFRTESCPLPMGVDTLASQFRADMLADAFYLNAMAESGWIEWGMIGAGQIDRFGNSNSTAVGPYEKPVLRFPGGGGACDIASLCRKTILIMNQKKRRFPERVDFITSPGYLDGLPNAREKAGLPPNTGPWKVITDMAVYGFTDGELTLESVHAHLGVTVEQARAEIGWPLREADTVIETPEPTVEELEFLREQIAQAGPNHIARL
jgi:acyl CoA:acetate/3-ketoacid CoA transferase beta subunit